MVRPLGRAVDRVRTWQLGGIAEWTGRGTSGERPAQEPEVVIAGAAGCGESWAERWFLSRAARRRREGPRGGFLVGRPGLTFASAGRLRPPSKGLQVGLGPSRRRVRLPSCPFPDGSGWEPLRGARLPPFPRVRGLSVMGECAAGLLGSGEMP